MESINGWQKIWETPSSMDALRWTKIFLKVSSDKESWHFVPGLCKSDVVISKYKDVYITWRRTR